MSDELANPNNVTATSRTTNGRPSASRSTPSRSGAATSWTVRRAHTAPIAGSAASANAIRSPDAPWPTSSRRPPAASGPSTEPNVSSARCTPEP
ncbi:MAG: hypothetical protein QM733_20485 [Ilumatobacteraceae bacterium]